MYLSLSLNHTFYRRKTVTDKKILSGARQSDNANSFLAHVFPMLFTGARGNGRQRDNDERKTVPFMNRTGHDSEVCREAIFKNRAGIFISKKMILGKTLRAKNEFVFFVARHYT